MTEPQRNDGDIDPRLQQMHGQGMSNDVGCYLTLRKVGLTLARSTDRELQTLGDIGPAQSPAESIRE
jgi:hypothetical protein